MERTGRNLSGMFLDITSTVKKKTLYRERYILPEPLSDTQNQKYLKSRKKRVTKMPVKSDMGKLLKIEHP